MKSELLGQDEWLEEVKWGAFGHTLYEASWVCSQELCLELQAGSNRQADYLNHREFVIFNGK